MRYLKPLLFLLGLAIIIGLLWQFGPWNLAVPWPFVRAFLIAIGSILTLLAISLFISWVLDRPNRIEAARERELVLQRHALVEAPVVVEAPIEYIIEQDGTDLR